jgi:HSP20 family protein
MEEITMSLIKYGPYSGFEAFPAFRNFEETLNRFFTQPEQRPWVPAVDIRETDHELIVKADVPDVKFEDIDVRLENGTLTLRGERKFEQDKNEGGWHRVERSYGTFERVFTLPETVNPEGVKAEYKNGVLMVTLPKKELAKPRQVKVQVTNN